MSLVSYDRALRVGVAMITDNREAFDLLATFLSNLFDVDKVYVFRDVIAMRKKYREHRENGGGIKAWEEDESPADSTKGPKVV